PFPDSGGGLQRLFLGQYGRWRNGGALRFPPRGTRGALISRRAASSERARRNSTRGDEMLERLGASGTGRCLRRRLAGLPKRAPGFFGTESRGVIGRTRRCSSAPRYGGGPPSNGLGIRGGRRLPCRET